MVRGLSAGVADAGCQARVPAPIAKLQYNDIFGIMELLSAAQALSCLGHELRLRVYRQLMVLGPEGRAAGDIARATGVPLSTMSFHLGQLDDCGLVFSWRVGRSVRYAVDLKRTRDLLSFLVEECCQGDPHLCDELVQIGRSQTATQGVRLMEEERAYNVLFLCTGNSARSIMAECILNRLGQGRFRAYSAGSSPTGTVHPMALERLKQQNYPTANLRSKGWDEFAGENAPTLDFVFTVCDKAASETCPVWPGQPMTAHWGVPDPAAAEGTEDERRRAFSEALRLLYARISIFTSLPIRALDALALQRRLDEIGQAGAEASVG